MLALFAVVVTAVRLEEVVPELASTAMTLDQRFEMSTSLAPRRRLTTSALLWVLMLWRLNRPTAAAAPHWKTVNDFVEIFLKHSNLHTFYII